ncbi:hypothetical protein CC117_11950 [Parafrankia colletiae]|uniref:Dienelactone hydrolase-like enzyme n=1 Tax=Parafrankia colletiae TaxID=573497 RepID=A0A1S1RAK2_9ACTN|nr:hypothetical protein [Parafrankia colletiae]MCK9900765.1 hypothetical protein [Frankia sp. Cpl3]OHV42292.1 hypothetical protein CC117_11950 [Parafrankia colletiae]
MSDYQHLGVYSDLVRVARARHGGPVPAALPGPATRALVFDTLGFGGGEEAPGDVRVEQRWRSGDLLGEELSWSVGFGPRTHAYLLKPADAEGPLPGVLALHSHDGLTYYGKEKVADGPAEAPPVATALRARQYGGRAFADDLVSRPDVAPRGIGCVGLSGGGARAALLQATCEKITAAVVVGMMSTYDGLLDRHVAGHGWLFFPATWPRHGDWPDLAACRAPSPLLVQYNRNDQLFSPAGMRAAHDRLTAHYRHAAAPGGYTGQFFDGSHKFDMTMQQAAFAWLRQYLAGVIRPA